ncbi:MAG: hypothetical protein V7661_05660 [Sulfitobacter sp.]
MADAQQGDVWDVLRPTQFIMDYWVLVGRAGTEERDHRQDHPNNCGIPGYQPIGEFGKPWCEKHTKSQNKAQIRRHQIMPATAVTCNDESQKARNHQQPCLTDEKIAFGCLARNKQKWG